MAAGTGSVAVEPAHAVPPQGHYGPARVALPDPGAGPQEERSACFNPPAGGGIMTLLKIDNLTHWFGGLRAVSDFTLDLQEGELLAVIGPNGAGKTTVFNLITGVYHPTEGTIIFQGNDLV